MVRTGAKNRVQLLTEVYEANTSLRLKPIHSDVDYLKRQETIEELRIGAIGPKVSEGVTRGKVSRRGSPRMGPKIIGWRGDSCNECVTDRRRRAAYR